MDVRQFVKRDLVRLVSIGVAGFSIACVSGIAQEGAPSDRNAAANDNARVRTNLAFDVTSIRPAPILATDPLARQVTNIVQSGSHWE
jgi:hypothetical protein